MRVFGLGAGRCGTHTLVKAFEHATNLTAGHETAAGSYYPLDYPDDHFESDLRLAWLLGNLADRYPEARYVHIMRDPAGVARSFAPDEPDMESSRDVQGFHHVSNFAGVALGRVYRPGEDVRRVALRYCVAVDANIRTFLVGRPHVVLALESLAEDFPAAWALAEAKGDLEAAVAECRVRHHNRDDDHRVFGQPWEPEIWHTESRITASE